MTSPPSPDELRQREPVWRVIAQHGCHGLQVLQVPYGAAGIGGVGENEEFGLGGDGCLAEVGIDVEGVICIDEDGGGPFKEDAIAACNK